MASFNIDPLFDILGVSVLGAPKGRFKNNSGGIGSISKKGDDTFNKFKMDMGKLYGFAKGLKTHSTKITSLLEEMISESLAGEYPQIGDPEAGNDREANKFRIIYDTLEVTVWGDWNDQRNGWSSKSGHVEFRIEKRVEKIEEPE